MILYFATTWSYLKNITLNENNANNRLLSYFYARDIKNDNKVFHNYVKTGIFPQPTKKEKNNEISRTNDEIDLR